MPAVSVSSEEATNQISGADLHPNHLGAMSTVPYINESDFATDEEKYPASLCSSTAALLSQEAVLFEWSNDTLAEPFKGDKVIQFHKAADMVDYYYLLDLEDCSVSLGKFEHADKQIR
ncbi:hypothetical protein BABINDRAFT_163569 [Babjeviella inositovora NRRL Y-12698]|uniref:Uncharacterized protein n=1 Tax=Babjeviella inositovora NRRL Y-12698 TaxID=984486 RepID=A0A1E3QHY2_9ASCO|nr:uncharacterized protein BABINDRAFT_163569 [Babjeviella inositovora NRRL Y-12698]ODQ77299.1 hypothetical protein BABINDRAFT_163569 [Babjeviella inositovora NRRL Y-12698]